MKSIPILCVDAFTSRPFSGNPAAVCLLDEPAPDGWMQSLAGEMNLSETAFPIKTGGNEFNLRWMTPTVEVDLCGHATLAAAHALWTKGRADKSKPITFNTRSGALVASLTDGGITLDFPLAKPEPCPPQPELIAALCAVNPMNVERGGPDYLVELCCAPDVREISPDFVALAKIPMRGVIVTAAGDEAGVDFVSRFFAPAAGINEDPVTGSAHCALAPYWAGKLAKTSFNARQVSKRGGELTVEIRGERVLITGRAVTVWEGAVASYS
ncbi:MAG: PhzF family phenazine biosynthesis protein [Nitrospinae bacterium]|nr:PhzF family phenazine biosynthesis protein [Nitrospinota bacterium]